MLDWADVVLRVEAFARADLAGNDASHDFEHVDRVRRLALRLARAEPALADASGADDAPDSEPEAPESDTPDAFMRVVECAALLHDVKDHKYCAAGEDADTAGQHAVGAFLRDELQLDGALVSRVVYVVANVSYSKQMRLAAEGRPVRVTRELAVVRDADRLDAIGAVGVARCFTYTGMIKRPLYEVEGKGKGKVVGKGDDDGKAQGEGDGDGEGEGESQSSEKRVSTAPNDSAIGHFHDKLFKVKQLMHTAAGKAEAEQRHAFMQAFVAQLTREVET